MRMGCEEMIIEYENYQIRPYSNNLCWEIFTYRPVKDKKTNEIKRYGWCSMGVYPTSFGGAIEYIYERELKAGTDVVSLKVALDQANKISKRLRALKTRASEVVD